MNVDDEHQYQSFKEAVKKSRIVSLPQNNISTFGNTIYNYYFVGKLSENITQVREGHIKINRPLFLTPFTERNLLKGFSPNHEEMMKKLLGDIKSENFVFVEYQFEHIPRHSWTEKVPYPIFLGEIKSKYSGSLFNVLLTGAPEYWNMSLIKFCLKIIQKSFPLNLGELEERGFLDKNRIPPQIKKKVEHLFAVAKKDSKEIRTLGDFLVENNIFDIYEDSFFNLMGKSKKNV